MDFHGGRHSTIFPDLGLRRVAWRSARASASSLLTRSTTLKNRARLRRQAPGDRDGEVRLPRSGAPDQYQVALRLQEGAASQIAHQRLVHRRLFEVDLVDRSSQTDSNQSQL
jgi:hypothetical protein